MYDQVKIGLTMVYVEPSLGTFVESPIRKLVKYFISKLFKLRSKKIKQEKDFAITFDKALKIKTI